MEHGNLPSKGASTAALITGDCNVELLLFINPWTEDRHQTRRRNKMIRQNVAGVSNYFN